MPTSLKGQVIAITGAASGIGRATATLLASHGAYLSLADNNEAGLASIAEQLVRDHAGARVFVRKLDVRSSAACNSWIADTVEHFGNTPLAGAANLAGVFGPSIAQERGTIRNLGDDEFDFVMDVNCRGVFNCLRAQLQNMQEGEAGRRGGSIVNAASVAGMVGVEGNSPYVASKHAVVGMTRTAAKEEGSRAIRVNCIAPGIIATPMMKGIEQAKGTTKLFGEKDPGALARKGEAEEVAKAAVYLLSDESSFVNGTLLPVDGGWIC